MRPRRQGWDLIEDAAHVIGFLAAWSVKMCQDAAGSGLDWTANSIRLFSCEVVELEEVDGASARVHLPSGTLEKGHSSGRYTRSAKPRSDG